MGGISTGEPVSPVLCVCNHRRLGYALLTDFAGTERNPDFVDEALAAVGGNRKRPVIVMCGRGGSLDSSVVRKGKKFTPPERLFGTQSRYFTLSCLQLYCTVMGSA